MARRIDDHSGFPGKGDSRNPLPNGCKSQYFNSADGDGELRDYQDTSSKIESAQEAGVSKMKKHPQPPMDRN